jgi:dTDP-4-dehydrorhamnose 3,5-epimerase
MGPVTIDDVVITNLSRITTKGGDVLRALKKSENTFAGFGEAYFSQINFQAVKAWKKHNSQISNLIIPVGSVRFVVVDELGGQGVFDIKQDNYQRITIPPGLWFGFQGLSEGTNLILNISSIEHNPLESERLDIHEIKFDWGSES